MVRGLLIFAEDTGLIALFLLAPRLSSEKIGCAAVRFGGRREVDIHFDGGGIQRWCTGGFSYRIQGRASNVVVGRIRRVSHDDDLGRALSSHFDGIQWFMSFTVSNCEILPLVMTDHAGIPRERAMSSETVHGIGWIGEAEDFSRTWLMVDDDRASGFEAGSAITIEPPESDDPPSTRLGAGDATIAEDAHLGRTADESAFLTTPDATRIVSGRRTEEQHQDDIQHDFRFVPSIEQG